MAKEYVSIKNIGLNKNQWLYLESKAKFFLKK